MKNDKTEKINSDTLLRSLFKDDKEDVSAVKIIDVLSLYPGIESLPMGKINLNNYTENNKEGK